MYCDDKYGTHSVSTDVSRVLNFYCLFGWRGERGGVEGSRVV